MKLIIIIVFLFSFIILYIGKTASILEDIRIVTGKKFKKRKISKMNIINRFFLIDIKNYIEKDLYLSFIICCTSYIVLSMIVLFYILFNKVIMPFSKTIVFVFAFSGIYEKPRTFEYQLLKGKMSIDSYGKEYRKHGCLNKFLPTIVWLFYGILLLILIIVFYIELKSL